nr:uncharacterized protein DDB_G0283357 isoform X2 [Onthophagus taurus]
MPETMATFPNKDEDIPPDIQNYFSSTSSPKLTPKLNCDDLNSKLGVKTEDSSFSSYNLKSSIDNDDSYSTNLTDEAFGSYEANLAGFNINDKNKIIKDSKSNQTSFSDLSSLTIYYIESDDDDDVLRNNNVDASTETTSTNLSYRLRKCISDPVYNNSNSGKKIRNSFHKDLNEALSSLLWQPYEYQNVESTDDENQDEEEIEDSSIDCSDLEDTNNGEEAVNNLHRQQRQQRQKHQQLQQQRTDEEEEGDPQRRSRDGLPLSRSRLSTAPNNSFSVSCANEGSAALRVRDGIFSEMTENLSATTEKVIQQNGENATIALRNLSQVNIVGLPSNRSNLRNTNSLTTGQFKYNANVNSANIVNLNNHHHLNHHHNHHHQRHHSQIETNQQQTVPISHIRSLSVPKKLDNNNSGDEQRRFPPINVSNVNVNYYRAVPANVVSTVPQIQCVTSNDCVSNVNIVQAMPLGSTSYSNLAQNQQNLQQCAVTTFGSSIITQHFPSGNTYNITSSVPIQVQTNQNVFSTNTTEVTIHGPPNTSNSNSTNLIQSNPIQSNNNNHQIQIINRPAEVTRTFTSTEAQTDDTLGLQPDVQTQTTTTSTSTTSNNQTSREQRRRERRERRHHRRTNNSINSNNGNGNLLMHQIQQNDHRLPDLLNSHMPPSYNNSVLGGGPPPMVNGAGLVSAPLVQTMVPNPIVGSPLVTFPGPVVAGQVPLVQPGPLPVQVAAPSGFRFPFQGTGFRRSRYSEDSPKSCCGLLSMKPGSLRWFIALIAFVAVCCVLVGTVLGAMRTSGRDHLTVSLLMIGVGIVLITVSGIAWKLTSHDSSTCRSMLGLGSTESVDACARRFVPRLPPSYGRPHHPYAAMMYPEFQYRPPPPSYQASMQEYRLRLLLLDRGHTPQIQAGIQNAVSPPPTYRSHAGSLLRAPLSSRRDAQSEYSCPPSYRSQTSSSNRPNGANNNTLPPSSVLHSRAQSLSLSESNHESVNVVLHNAEEDIGLDNITLDSLKMEPEPELNPLKMLLKGSTSDLEGNKDGNLVTIVQTSDQSPVIVTVSGSSNTEELNLQTTDIQSEMQILAHL